MDRRDRSATKSSLQPSIRAREPAGVGLVQRQILAADFTLETGRTDDRRTR